MKYSNYIGVLAAVLLIASCFAPWVFIPPINTTITGFYTAGTNFGNPGLINVIMSSVAIVCFLLSFVWAKRLNLFICAFNLAWAFRNFLITGQCEMGECPEKRWGIYATISLSILLMIMSLFPRLAVKPKM